VLDHVPAEDKVEARSRSPESLQIAEDSLVEVRVAIELPLLNIHAYKRALRRQLDPAQ
jgi:hypothetical protein